MSKLNAIAPGKADTGKKWTGAAFREYLREFGARLDAFNAKLSAMESARKAANTPLAAGRILHAEKMEASVGHGKVYDARRSPKVFGKSVSPTTVNELNKKFWSGPQ